MNRKQSLILCSGAFFIGLAFAWAFYTPRTFAASQLRTLAQTEADDQVCPLSDKQTEDAIQKFSEMMPTFTHPRCINCHGAMNPFAANTTHLGGRIGPKFRETIEHDDILGKDITLVVPDLEDSDSFASRCLDCHSAFTGSRGWTIPPVKVYFVGKNSVQLCKQMKREFGGELQEFFDHLDHDFLGFIQEAFRGTRGLDDNGQATYLNETGRDLLPVPESEKPPVSHEAFVAQGKAWLEAMGYHGEGTKGGITCGCESHHYILKLSTDETFTYVKQDFRGEGKGHADLSIPITFKDDGSFTGQATAKRPWHGMTVSTAGTCDVKYPDFEETWKVEGAVDKISMQVKVSLDRAASVGTSVCSFGGKTVTGTGPTFADQGIHELELDATVGDIQTVEFKGFLKAAEGGDSWIINATIVEQGQ